MAPDEDGLIPRPTLYEPEPPWVFECDFNFAPYVNTSYSPRWFLDQLVINTPMPLCIVTGI